MKDKWQIYLTQYYLVKTFVGAYFVIGDVCINATGEVDQVHEQLYAEFENLT